MNSTTGRRQVTSWPEAESGANATLREGPEVDTIPWARVSALDGTTGGCNITGVALNVSLRNYEVPEILATPTPLPLTLELAEARARGLGSDHLVGQDIH